MHGVLIDPFTRETSIVEFADGNSNLTEWYRLLDCGCIDIRDLGKYPASRGVNLALVVDDEGLYSKGEAQRFFALAKNPQIFAGKALVIALDGPNTVDLADPVFVHWLVGTVVQWQDERLRFTGMTTTEDEVDHPAFGRVHRITNTPHFAIEEDK